MLDKRQIRTLNKKYLNHDFPTDVITFNYTKTSGDIAISLDAVKENAKIYNTEPKDELLLYIIHGILHLLGYEDNTRKSKERMFKKQTEIFDLCSG